MVETRNVMGKPWNSETYVSSPVVFAKQKKKDMITVQSDKIHG